MPGSKKPENEVYAAKKSRNLKWNLFGTLLLLATNIEDLIKLTIS